MTFFRVKLHGKQIIPRQGGIDIRWRTAAGASLQIIASFADIDLPMPDLMEGETLWPTNASGGQTLRPNDIIVRLRAQA